MIIRKLLVFLLLLTFQSNLILAQSSIEKALNSQADRLIFKPESEIPAYIKFKSYAQPNFLDLQSWLSSNCQIDENLSLQLLSTDEDQIGFKHFRYQQLSKGLPVEGTMLIVHTKHGKIVSMNGLIYKKLNAESAKIFSEEQALQKALTFMDAKQYMWQEPANEALIKEENNDQNASWYPKGSLVFVGKDNSSIAEQYRLAYKFDIYATEPLNRQYVYIDASNGKVLAHLNRIHTSDSTVTAKTAMAGDQRITTDYYAANSFRLRETKRGNGIETYNLQKGTNYGNAVDFTDSDTLWNNTNANLDQYATDAHFGAEMTYDYFKKTYNRNSIDGAGYKLRSYIHYSSGYVNAFWDGTRMTYGDGNGAGIYPLVSIDIAGHEITHGLTSNTANLVYSYESGALNESFSDILGTAVEWYGDSSRFDWELAPKIGTSFRSMSNPKVYSDPNCYKGQYWYTGAADNGGVHTNSGVQNYWFYLLCNGGKGTNDNGSAYAVDSIGMKKAAAIAFRTLTVYLSTNSQYADARTYSLIAAADLFGDCSDEVFAVAAAWHAVGVGFDLYADPTVQTLQNTNDLLANTNNNVILMINVGPACNTVDTAFTFNFNTTGTSKLSSIKNAKLWYTGASATFATTTQFGSTKTAPSGVFTFNGSKPLIKNSDNYFWLTYDIDAAAKINERFDANLSSVQMDTLVVPLDTAPAGYRLINYCIPTVTNGCYSGGMCISNFVLSNLSNNTGRACSNNAYNNYTSKTVKLEQSTSYFGQVAVTDYSAYINIWIDYNDDGVFNDSNERLLNAYNAAASSTSNFSVSIASNASLGDHRMRVRHQYTGSYTSLSACANGAYGEIEDYTATIVTQSNAAYINSHVSQITGKVSRSSTNNAVIRLNVDVFGSLNPLKLYTLNFTTAGTTDNADISTATVFYTGSSAIFATTTQFGAALSNPGNSFSVNDSIELSSGTNYFWLAYDINSAATIGDYLDATCDSLTLGTSNYIPDTTDPSGNLVIGVCVPPTSTSPCTYMHISKVVLDSISNSSGCNTNSYADYSNLSTSTSQGSVVNYSVNLYQYNQYVSIWIDVNNDAIFDTSERVVKNKYSASLVASGYFSLPANISVGKHLVRITADYTTSYNSTACSQLYYGETEDYTLNVTAGISMSIVSIKNKQNRLNVQPATTNNNIMQIEIVTAGIYAPIPIKSFTINTNGTTDTSEILNARLWYTAGNNTFSTTTQFGSTINNPGSGFVLNDSISLVSGYNYFWLSYDVAATAILGNKVDAGCDSLMAGSVYLYADTANPYGNRLIDYCVPPTTTWACTYMYTSNVTIDSINKSSGCNSTSYSNFTNLKTTTNQGSLVNYSATFYQYNQYLNIWIDYDNNGKFDTGEYVVRNQYSSSFFVSGSFQIPVTAPVGLHRVRVKADYYTLTNNACDQLVYGETEDYSIYVDTIQSMSITSATTLQNKSAIQPNTTDNDIIRVKVQTKNVYNPLKVTSFTFNTTGTTNTADIDRAKLWYTGADSNFSTTTQVGGVVTKPGSSSFDFTDSITLLTGANYFWITYDINDTALIGNHADASCLGFTIGSNSYTADTAAPYGDRIINYCTPTGGVNNNYNNSYTFGIVKVELASISKSSGVPNTAAAYYSDYTASKTNLNSGITDTLIVTPGSSASTYTQATIAWVDWNKNLIFDSTEEVGHNYNHTGICKLALSVPSNQSGGSYRLRIMSGYGYYYNIGTSKFTPCVGQKPVNLDIGECEDYTIDIIPALPKPTISPSNMNYLCLGSSLILTTAYDTGYTYNWFKNGSSIYTGKGHPYDSLSLTPSAAGSDAIYLKISDGYNQNKNSDSAYMITSAPSNGGTASASAGTVCAGDTTTLSLSGYTGNIMWQQLNAGVWTNTGQTATPNKLVISGNATYRAMVTSGNCPADSSNSVTINYNPKSVGGSISPSSSNICEGDSINLSLSSNTGNIDWQYYNGSIWQSLGNTGTSIYVAPTTTTSYRVGSTSGVCSTAYSNTSSINVSKKVNPGTAGISATAICNGDSITLTLSGSAGSIQWQQNNGGSWSALATTNPTKLKPSSNATYRAFVTSGVCPSDSSNQVSVTLNPLPVAGNISASASSICYGDSVNLTLSNNTGSISWQSQQNGVWSNMGLSSNSIYVTPSATTSYRAYITAGQCGSDSTSATTITVTPLAVAGTLTATKNAICNGDSTKLVMTGYTGNISWIYNTGSGWNPYNYTSSSITMAPTINTSFRGIVTSGACGIDSTNVISITLLPAAIAGTISTPKLFICPGSSADIVLNGSNGNIDWQSNDGSGWKTMSQTNDTATASPAIQTSYRAMLSTVCGVDSSNEIQLTILVPPTAAITPGGPKTFCNGDSIVLAANASAQYLWSTGAITQNIVLKATNTVYVKVTDVNGCSATSTSHTYTFSTPMAPTLVQQGDSLMATPANAASYIWKLAGNAVKTTVSNYYRPTIKGDYTVEYRDSIWCLSPVSNQVTFSFVGIRQAWEKTALQVWPNPGQGIYYLKGILANQSSALIRVTDLTGKQLMQQRSNPSDGMLNTTVDLSNFAQGIYLLYIETENGMRYEPIKLVKE